MRYSLRRPLPWRLWKPYWMTKKMGIRPRPSPLACANDCSMGSSCWKKGSKMNLVGTSVDLSTPVVSPVRKFTKGLSSFDIGFF